MVRLRTVSWNLDCWDNGNGARISGPESVTSAAKHGNSKRNDDAASSAADARLIERSRQLRSDFGGGGRAVCKLYGHSEPQREVNPDLPAPIPPPPLEPPP
jgi:hypothetical protein